MVPSSVRKPRASSLWAAAFAMAVLMPVSISHGVQRTRPRPPCERSTGQAAGLHYRMSIFGQCRPQESLPMLIALHGMGDRPREPFGELPIPARVVMPQAPLPWGQGYSWFPFRSSEVTGARMAPEIRKTARRVAAMIDEVIKRHPTQGKPVVMGVSQGGILSFALALRHQHTVGQAFPIAGWLPRALWPGRQSARSVPTFAMHGMRDAVIPAGGTVTMVQRLSRRGHPMKLETFQDAGHDVTPAMRGRLYNELVRALRSKSSKVARP